jgi:hypothetical protein
LIRFSKTRISKVIFFLIESFAVLSVILNSFSLQIQLVKEGKMHGQLKLYWAKQIAQWTESPEQALEFTLYLHGTRNIYFLMI